ncbi:methyltransferase [Ruania alkalisoli]|uniref:Methyltransferase n=1 Tax=Ruania alkalisoli TaxID=2779775 RepID=A0A7M1SUW0_9MICO|nr:methyltransferase [Ruania alkalisoli]QOR71369.1 methyltransferase [Ruania alkalisoli]
MHDPQVVARLRADLDGAGFGVDQLAEVLGTVATAALGREQVLPAVRAARAAGPEPAAVLARLFILGDTVTEDEAGRALPRTGVDRAQHGGLLTINDRGQVRGAVDLRPIDTPHGAFYLAADLGEATTGRAVERDHVLGVGGASRTLAELTVRRPVRRALDLGTGSGVQALNIAPFADQVVATDLSARALTFARFNAALNGVELDLREGSMLEPVTGERFDLVVSNPPFVITPRESGLTEYTYRDGGRRGDDLVRALITGVADVLAPGGIAQLLGNWEVHEGEGLFDRIQQWLADSGLDGWVIQRESADPAEYAETWLRDGGITPDRDRLAWDKGYAAWLADFEARGVTAVGFGYITLHKPNIPDGAASPPQPWHRVEEVTGTLPGAHTGGLWPAIADTLTAKDALARLSDTELAGHALTVATDVTEERHYRPGSADPEVIVLRQGGGFGRTVRADTALAAVVGTCDGDLTVAQIAAGVAALTGLERDAVLDSVLPDVRGLVTDGLLRLPRR